MPCSRCNKKDPNTTTATCAKKGCESAGKVIELHLMHLKNPKDKLGQCEKCSERLVSEEVKEEEKVPLLAFQKKDTSFALFKEQYVSKISCCHSCLGARELAQDAENRLTRLNAKQTKCLKVLAALLGGSHQELDDVGESIPNEERKRAHCIIANQHLEWYLPGIVISFCKLANPKRYGITPPETYFFNTALNFVNGIWRKAGQKTDLALYDFVTSELARLLEDNQDFPATVQAITAAMRYSLADMIKSAPLDEDEPKIIPTLPPKHGGGDPLTCTTMDDKKESFKDSSAIVHLFTALGQCRTPVFMVGNQCEACELAQGEDPLIKRHLRQDQAGVSMKKLIEAYHGHGGVFALTVDFLRPCLDYLGKKLWVAGKDAGKNSQKRLERWLSIVLSKENWIIFSLYLTTCLLEASYGVSPFRSGDSKVDANPCPITHV